MTWMIYGATGFTGKLTVEEAVKRGHSPLIAGRNEAKLKPIAEQYNLPYEAFSLDSVATIVSVLKKHSIEAVLHIAGPFIHTAEPMMKACLQAGVHYLDITGEAPVYEMGYALHQEAEDKGIVIMSGVGYDVVPSDCLIKHVADQLPDATHLEVSYNFRHGMFSQGTLKTGIEMNASTGNLVRRNGKLIKVPFASETKQLRFMDEEAEAVQSIWGDVITGYRTTGIPNITTFIAYRDKDRKELQSASKINWLLRFKFVREYLKNMMEQRPEGPTQEMQDTVRMNFHVIAKNAKGDSVEAWLETAEAYVLTARTGVRSVERVLDGNYKGALTPATAFGADFILDIEGTIRKDSLDD